MMILFSPPPVSQPTTWGTANGKPVTMLVEAITLVRSTKQPADSTLITAENRLASSFFPEKAMVLQFQKRTTVSLIKSSTLVSRAFSSVIAVS
jgi:hypothetical protein